MLKDPVCDKTKWEEMVNIEFLLATYFEDFPDSKYQCMNLEKNWVVEQLLVNNNEFLCLPNLDKYNAFCVYSYKQTGGVCGIYLLDRIPGEKFLPFPDAAINRGVNTYWGIYSDGRGSMICERDGLKVEIPLIATTDEELDFLKNFIEIVLEEEGVVAEDDLCVGDLA